MAVLCDTKGSISTHPVILGKMNNNLNLNQKQWDFICFEESLCCRNGLDVNHMERRQDVSQTYC